MRIITNLGGEAGEVFLSQIGIESESVEAKELPSSYSSLTRLERLNTSLVIAEQRISLKEAMMLLLYESIAFDRSNRNGVGCWENQLKNSSELRILFASLPDDSDQRVVVGAALNRREEEKKDEVNPNFANRMREVLNLPENGTSFAITDREGFPPLGAFTLFAHPNDFQVVNEGTTDNPSWNALAQIRASLCEMATMILPLLEEGTSMRLELLHLLSGLELHQQTD